MIRMKERQHGSYYMQDRVPSTRLTEGISSECFKRDEGCPTSDFICDGRIVSIFSENNCHSAEICIFE